MLGQSSRCSGALDRRKRRPSRRTGKAGGRGLARGLCTRPRPPRALRPRHVNFGRRELHLMSRRGERRAGMAAGNLSTPNIQLGRHQFESSDLANRRGSGWGVQLGPRYRHSQVRRPATAAGDYFGREAPSSRRRRSSRAGRRSAASRPSTSAGGGGGAPEKPADVTKEEAVLLLQLSRIKELRSGVDKMAGTQWTPRGQHVLPRHKEEDAAAEAEDGDIGAEMRELHERTMRLEDVVDDKIARREEWLDLWGNELQDLGWERPEKTGRRALHGGTAGDYVDPPAMTGIERHEGEWRRAKHTVPAAASPSPVAGATDRQERLQSSGSVASAGSLARRHPQHKTVGRRANAGLSVPYRGGRYQAVVQHRQAYTSALRGVAEVDMSRRRDAARAAQMSSSPFAMLLVDAKVASPAAF